MLLSESRRNHALCATHEKQIATLAKQLENDEITIGEYEEKLDRLIHSVRQVQLRELELRFGRELGVGETADERAP